MPRPRAHHIIHLNPLFQARFIPDLCPHSSTTLSVDIPLDVDVDPQPIPVIRTCNGCGARWVSRSAAKVHQPTHEGR